MTIQSNGSFLSLSVSHGVFHMAAQVKLIKLLIVYIIFGLLGVLKYKLVRKFSK